MQKNHGHTRSLANYVTISGGLRPTILSASSAMVVSKWYGTALSLADVAILMIFCDYIVNRTVNASWRGDCAHGGWSSS